MMVHHTERRQEEFPNGIRITEIRYSSYVDDGNRLKLTRCVGKSYLVKNSTAAGVCPAINQNAESA